LTYPRIPPINFDETAAQYPKDMCTFFGTSDHRQIQQVRLFAAGLRGLGTHKGDRVALLLPNSPQYLIAYYGALKAGAVVVPLNPLYTEQELTFHLTHSEAKAIVTLPLFLEKVASLVPKTPLQHIICSRLAGFLPWPLNLVQGFRERTMISRAGSITLVDFRWAAAPDFGN
jgi:long-chain acyl-CoA synthetase